MKFKLLLAFAAASFMSMSAQGLIDAMEYYRANQPEEAKIIIEKNYNDVSMDKATANFYLGKVAIDSKDNAAAKSYFEKGIQIDANNPLNYVGLGQLALINGDKSAAETYFKDARKMVKKDATLLTEIARAYYDVDPVVYKKDIDGLLKDATKVDKEEPSIYILQADIMAPTNIGEAAALYTRAMESSKSINHPEAYVKYARTYFPVNKQFAINKLIEYLDMRPGTALVQRELGEQYYKADALTRAAEVYGEYIKNPSHFQRDEQRYASLLNFGKEYAKSNEIINGILRQDPTNFFMNRLLFYNYVSLEEFDKAIAQANKFLALNNGEYNGYDYKNLALAYNGAKQFDKACEAMEKAVELNPDKTDFLSDLSEMYVDAGRYPEAATAMQRLIDKGDYSVNDMVILARRYLSAATSTEVGTLEHDEYSQKAKDAINYVYEKVPDNLVVVSTRGRIYFTAANNTTNDEVADAFETMLNALDQDPENVTKKKSDYQFVLNQLGLYYKDKGDTETALKYYNRFLELDPENESLKKYIELLSK